MKAITEYLSESVVDIKIGNEYTDIYGNVYKVVKTGTYADDWDELKEYDSNNHIEKMIKGKTLSGIKMDKNEPLVALVNIKSGDLSVIKAKSFDDLFE